MTEKIDFNLDDSEMLAKFDSIINRLSKIIIDAFDNEKKNFSDDVNVAGFMSFLGATFVPTMAVLFTPLLFVKEINEDAIIDDFLEFFCTVFRKKCKERKIELKQLFESH